MASSVVVYTAGHSNQPLQRLEEILARAKIEALVDVRQFPMSRRNPQFNQDALAMALADMGIEYLHRRELGGRRVPRADSPNTALRDPGFRGFADYMATDEFTAALDALIELAARKRTAIMCAESLPWRCHRSLISDALVARGVEVHHLLGAGERLHTLSPLARVADGRVGYPALL